MDVLWRLCFARCAFVFSPIECTLLNDTRIWLQLFEQRMHFALAECTNMVVVQWRVCSGWCFPDRVPWRVCSAWRAQGVPRRGGPWRVGFRRCTLEACAGRYALECVPLEGVPCRMCPARCVRWRMCLGGCAFEAAPWRVSWQGRVRTLQIMRPGKYALERVLSNFKKCALEGAP